MILQTNSLCRVYGSLEVGRITAIEPLNFDVVQTCFVELGDGVREIPFGFVSDVWTAIDGRGMCEQRLRAPGLSDGGEGFE